MGVTTPVLFTILGLYLLLNAQRISRLHRAGTGLWGRVQMGSSHVWGLRIMGFGFFVIGSVILLVLHSRGHFL